MPLMPLCFRVRVSLRFNIFPESVSEGFLLGSPLSTVVISIRAVYRLPSTLNPLAGFFSVSDVHVRPCFETVSKLSMWIFAMWPSITIMLLGTSGHIDIHAPIIIIMLLGIYGHTDIHIHHTSRYLWPY